MAREMDEGWQNWVKFNIARGCDKDGIFKILIDEGFEYQQVVNHMGHIPSRNVDSIANPLVAAQQAEGSSGFESRIKIDRDSIFIPNAQRMDTDLAEFYTLDNFLNQEECDRLIALIKTRLRPSEVANNAGTSTDFRTSSTCDLGVIDDDFVAEIDRRICAMLGIDASYSEVIQGQYYEVGQEFKPHTDYFEASEYEEYASERGQRTYTFFIYLNDVEAGGETEFTELGQKIRPRAGNAVIWSSLDAEGRPNPNTMHHAHPVKAGYKAVITKWFRARGNGPMLSKEDNELLPNFTRLGFHKTMIDPELFQEIIDFFRANGGILRDEYVEGGFIFTEGKSACASGLIDLSQELRDKIHESLLSALSEWSGIELEPTFVYGIRTYHRGAVLKEHRDRQQTHIISAIINVDQNVEQDWCLHIEDNYYRRHKVVLKPGEIIFYEGARLQHGRPEPLAGESFSNIFCHYMPRHAQ